MMAPMTASAMEILRPAKKYGSALGNWSLTNTWRRDAATRRSRSTARSSVARKPWTVFTTVGKKHTMAVITTFGVRPDPNQIRNSGATATLGIVWDAMISG